MADSEEIQTIKSDLATLKREVADLKRDIALIKQWAVTPKQVETALQQRGVKPPLAKR
jgi:hypothetical protein